MKRALLFLGLGLSVVGCASKTVADLKARGASTPSYQSAKGPMEFVGCVIPVYDATFSSGPAHMRVTTTGFEVLDTGIAAPQGEIIFAVISIDHDGAGSRVQGAVHKSLVYKRELAKLDAVIRQCV